jgi:hypothetical protein
MTAIRSSIANNDLGPKAGFLKSRIGTKMFVHLRNARSVALVPYLVTQRENQRVRFEVSEPTPELAEISDAAWREAARRSEIIRSLAENASAPGVTWTAPPPISGADLRRLTCCWRGT